MEWLNLSAPYDHWPESVIEMWYVKKTLRRCEEEAPFSEVHSYVLNMRVLWDLFKKKFKEDRNISFTKY